MSFEPLSLEEKEQISRLAKETVDFAIECNVLTRKLARIIIKGEEDFFLLIVSFIFNFHRAPEGMTLHQGDLVKIKKLNRILATLEQQEFIKDILVSAIELAADEDDGVDHGLDSGSFGSSTSSVLNRYTCPI